MLVCPSAVFEDHVLFLVGRSLSGRPELIQIWEVFSPACSHLGCTFPLKEMKKNRIKPPLHLRRPFREMVWKTKQSKVGPREFPIYSLSHLSWMFPLFAKSAFLDYLESIERVFVVCLFVFCMVECRL